MSPPGIGGANAPARFCCRGGCTVEAVHEATGIDPWFLDNVKQIVEYEHLTRAAAVENAEAMADWLIVGLICTTFTPSARPDSASDLHVGPPAGELSVKVQLLERSRADARRRP